MTLAELAVKLTANTAEFITGFSNAGLASKRFRADLSEHVQAIGGALDGVLSHFGEFGAILGGTLDQAAQSASRAVTAFGKIGGIGGTVIGATAGLAAAVAAVDVGAVGLAVHTAETIAKMSEMAQSAGVSVEALSSIGFAGKSVGIDLETTTKTLEKMGKSVFAAATAAPGAINAFTRLGIAVRDSEGAIRPTTEIFSDLSAKFAAMPDGITKTALAIQVFGRGGAQIIPLLNQGSAGLKEFIETAQALGVVLDDKTASAAQKFKEDLVTIEAAGQGVAIRLTKDLLPALDFLAAKLVESFKTGGAQNLIDKLAWLVKASIGVGDTFFHVFEQVGIILEGLGGEVLAVFNAIGAAIEAVARAGVGDFSGAKGALKAGLGGLKQETDNFLSASKKAWADNAAFINGTFSTTLPQARQKPTGPTPDVDAKAVKDGPLERIRARIEGLNEEAKGWEKVAAAGSEAEQFILEGMKKADAEFAKLKAEAAKSPAATAFVLKSEGTIKAAEEEIFFGESVKKAITELDKQKGKLEEQDKAAIELGNAYKLGGNAIREALVKAEFAQQAAVVQDLVAKHEQAVKVFGEESKQAKILADGVSVATQELNALVQAGINKKLHTIANVLSDESRSLAEQAPFVEQLGNAYLQGETAVRRARIELELLNYTLKNNLDPSRDSALIAEKRQLLIDADKQSYDLALKQEAAQFSLNAQYDDQIVKLERVREILQESGQSTLLIDAKLHDAQDSLLHQWDEAAFKVGTFGQKFQGVMGEVVIQGRAAGQAISQAFVSAIDGIETNLAKLLTGQKTNFKGVVQNLAEQATKAEIQKGVGAIAQSLGFGDKFKELVKGKPDGTQNNPLFVSIADVTSKGSSGLGKGLGGLGSLFGGKNQDQAGAGDTSANQANPLAKLFGGSSGGGSAIAALFGSAIGNAQGVLFGGGSKVKTGKGAPAQPVFVENPVTAMILTPVRVIVTNPVTIAGTGATGLPGAGGASSLTSLGISSALSRLGTGLPGLGGLASLFGGFLAGGGDMSPGSWYVAGERGPEIVRGPGSVIPASKFSGGDTIHNHFNYGNAAARDLFGFTEKQTQARHIRNLNIR